MRILKESSIANDVEDDLARDHYPENKLQAQAQHQPTAIKHSLYDDELPQPPRSKKQKISRLPGGQICIDLTEDSDEDEDGKREGRREEYMPV